MRNTKRLVKHTLKPPGLHSSVESPEAQNGGGDVGRWGGGGGVARGRGIGYASSVWGESEVHRNVSD